MNRSIFLEDFLPPLSSSSVQALESFIKFSNAKVATPSSAEVRLMESLNLAYRLKVTPN